MTEWFRPQLMRVVGSSFSGDADMAMEMVLSDVFEAVIYVEATTRARPNRRRSRRVLRGGWSSRRLD